MLSAAEFDLSSHRVIEGRAISGEKVVCTKLEVQVCFSFERELGGFHGGLRQVLGAVETCEGFARAWLLMVLVKKCWGFWWTENRKTREMSNQVLGDMKK